MRVYRWTLCFHPSSVHASFSFLGVDSAGPKEVLRVGDRFLLVGYLCGAVGAWMLVKKPAPAGFAWLAVGATFQLIGGFLQH